MLTVYCMTHMPSPTYADLKLTVTLLSLISVKLSESLSSVIPSPFSQITAVLKEWERASDVRERARKRGREHACVWCVLVCERASEVEREENCKICQGFPGVWLFLSTPVQRWLGSRAGGWVLVLFFLHARYRRCMSGAWLDSIVSSREIDSFRCFRAKYDRSSQFISSSPADHAL